MKGLVCIRLCVVWATLEDLRNKMPVMCMYIYVLNSFFFNLASLGVSRVILDDSITMQRLR